MKQIRRYTVACVIAWIICVGSIIAKEIQEDEMRAVIIDIELTEQQYEAFERLAKKTAAEICGKWRARDEISLIASGAVINKATKELRRMEQRSGQIRSVEPAEVTAPETPDPPAPAEHIPYTAAGATEPELTRPEPAPAASPGRLTKSGGVFHGVSGKETWYNLPMGGVIRIMRDAGFSELTHPFWIREDGCKMLGSYIMVAANLELRPRGTLVETSLGTGIVCDTGSFCQKDKTAIDIAVNW